MKAANLARVMATSKGRFCIELPYGKILYQKQLLWKSDRTSVVNVFDWVRYVLDMSTSVPDFWCLTDLFQNCRYILLSSYACNTEKTSHCYRSFSFYISYVECIYLKAELKFSKRVSGFYHVLSIISANNQHCMYTYNKPCRLTYLSEGISSCHGRNGDSKITIFNFYTSSPHGFSDKLHRVCTCVSRSVSKQ